MNRRNPELLDEDDLRQWVDYDRRSDLERWLRENGIRFRHGKAGKVVTTLTAVNTALAGNGEFGEIEFGASDGPATRKAS